MRPRRSSAVLLCSVVLLALPAAPAAAHTHPTAISLDAPGVVYVEATAHVDVSLIESDTPSRGHIQLTRRTYDQVLAGGSGFAVNPNGYIVTSAGILAVDRRPAEVYAVNHVFNERYGAAAPLPSDGFTTQHLAAGGRLDQRLQRCYQPNTTDVTGGCVVRTTVRVVVYPYVTNQEKYGALAAQVLTRNLASSPDPDVAVLKVAATSMPTVKLEPFDATKAPASTGEIPGAVLGFSGIPGTSHDLLKVNTHLIPKTGQAKPEDLKELGPALTQGLRGGPIIANEQQVVGFYPWVVLPPGSPAGAVAVNPAVPTLVDGASITKVLDAAGVDPRRGPTDGAFEASLHSFNNAEYAGSIPALRRTLELYAGHFKATADLTEALAKKGTPADKTGQGGGTGNVGASGGSSSSGGGNTFAWVAGSIAVLALLGLALLLAVRRRGGAVEGAVAGGKPTPAGGATARPPTAQQRTAKPRPTGTSSAAPAPAAPGGRAGAPAPRRPMAPEPAGDRPRSAVRASGPPPAGGVAVRPSVSVQPSAGAPGAPAPEGQPFCTSCGQPVAPNHQFCGWCGHRVG